MLVTSNTTAFKLNYIPGQGQIMGKKERKKELTWLLFHTPQNRDGVSAAAVPSVSRMRWKMHEVVSFHIVSFIK